MTWPYDRWTERLRVAHIIELLGDQDTVTRILNELADEMDATGNEDLAADCRRVAANGTP